MPSVGGAPPHIHTHEDERDPPFPQGGREALKDSLYGGVHPPQQPSNHLYIYIFFKKIIIIRGYALMVRSVVRWWLDPAVDI